MRKLGLGILILVSLGSLARAAEAQRLPPAFRSVEPGPLLTTTAFATPAATLAYSAADCRLHPVLLVTVGGLGGAAGGWLAYELTLGIWISAEGASPDATMRTIRTTLIATGAVMGVARAVYIARACRSH